jgi:uncharacterized protein
LRVVLDTNCFISCVGKKSPYRPVFDAYINGKFILCVSHEILLEYEEVFSRIWGPSVAVNLLGLMGSSLNTLLHDVHFNFGLVEKDADDNKFVDAYIASGADILVSNDREVLKLTKNEYPTIRVLKIEQFMDHLDKVN